MIFEIVRDIITAPYAFERTANLDKEYNLNDLGEIKTNPHRRQILANLLAQIIRPIVDSYSLYKDYNLSLSRMKY